MKFKPTHLKSQTGFSLVELLVVITIIAIVGSLALMQRGNANEQFQRQNVAREIKVALERARFDSVKRRADGAAVPFASVTIDVDGFTLVTDVNQDGDVTDTRDSVATPYPPNISITPRSGLSLPLTVSYNRRGEPDLTDINMLVCNDTCDYNSDTTANANLLVVTATGTVEMLPGGSNPATFPTPSVTTVPANTAVRSETYIAP